MCKKLIKYIAVCSLSAFTFGQVDYNSEIQPIFNTNCTSCHGGSDAEEGLNLSSYNNVMNGGDSGDVVIPYDHANSLLWQYINSGFMPPGNNDLTDAQVNLIAQWIDEGAFEEPGSNTGCTDSEAYSCANDNVWSNYIVDVGGIMYDNSCNWDWNTSTNQADYVGGCEYQPDDLPDGFVNPNHCQGYYNPSASNDDGSCRYYQAPYGEEVVFEVAGCGISLDWSAFAPPENADLESYHVQRCLGTGCTWMEGFSNNPNEDPNTTTSLFDELEWEQGVEIKYAIAVQYSNNPYWGWAIGASYITPEESSGELGDVNGDGTWNVLDIVNLANCVLAQNCPDIPNGCFGDMNEDGDFNVLDIVTLANCVLAQNCGGRVDDASESRLIIRDNRVSFEADGFIGGVQMTLTHSDGFSIEMTDRALLAEYITTGNETRLLVITPETDELFSFTGEFEITEIIVANSQYEISVDLPLAASFSLSDAYPNPFNPVTTMTLTMPLSGEMTVEVYNLLGQVVATLASSYMDASTYTLTWDAADVSSGMYFVKAQAGGFTTTQKLLLVK